MGINADTHVDNSIEMIAKAAVISEQLVLKVLDSLLGLLEDDKDKEKDFIIDEKTKNGKQTIKELIQKHKDGVVALDENLTKEQLKDYTKELNKLGVDFSVVKNDDDTHSFFFAAQNANVIEKALKNIVEKKNNVLESEQNKNAEKEIAEIKAELPKESVTKTKELYDKVSDFDDKQNLPKDINISVENLNKGERALFDKLQEVDALKKSLYTEEVKRVENLLDKKPKANDRAKGNDKESSNNKNYSMNKVKTLNNEIKKQENEKDKDKNKKQTVSR